jgi:hypothetical protein
MSKYALALTRGGAGIRAGAAITEDKNVDKKRNKIKILRICIMFPKS